MQVQAFIREKGWVALTEELGIEVREYENGFRVLNYSQIDSPKTHPIVLECRGLILDLDLNVICRPFDRFFNFGEAGTENFDFSACNVFSKEDGSLVKVYWNPIDNQWEIATRGTAFAEAPHVFGTAKSGTFRDWILNAMHFTEDEFQNVMRNFPKHNAFIFEYVGPENRIVTRYIDAAVILLGIRAVTGQEDPALLHWGEEFQKYGMNTRLPKIYSASSEDQIMQMVSTLTDLQEGFVAQEILTGRRVKIKSAQYVLVHQMRGNGSPTLNNLMELVLKNEQDELLVHFPEFEPFVTPIENALKEMIVETAIVYGNSHNYETQKDFAMAVKDTKVAPLCFKMRKNNQSISEAFDSMEMSQKKNLLLKYINEEE